ncbi:Colicin V production protein [Rubripirellula lacrimiformis]|uniref:Colicin V production protein n=1 Tax=Rubripirellula lacrimiformis TaxID=1930273 RepID=A0A517NL91_9BACT|nr:CvpA family protein [Rubripirellula lacrimiformis]QDT07907.1 Colicin V production protein [Rubripirellula lacrimiformis]
MLSQQPFDESLLPSPGMSMRWRLIWTALFFGPATYFAIQSDYIAAAIFSVTGFSAFAGYRTGVFSIFASTMAIIAAIAFAPDLGMNHAHRFSQWFGTTGLANRFLSIGVIGVVIAFAVIAVLWFILGRSLARRPALDRANRSLGFTLGIVQGVAGMLFFVGGMLAMEPIQRERLALQDASVESENVASNLILKTAEATRASQLGPYLIRYNPLTLMPELNKVQQFNQTAEVLSNPAKMGQLLNEPEIQALRRRPSVEKLVKELSADPEVSEMLNSGSPMTASTAMTLLSHPAVMELIDQPGFLEEATKAIQKVVPTTGLAR